MSHPLFFRGMSYFYPIGNTSAVRLTERLPPEQQANILLLACGDPRHILYTVYTNETDTASDVEPHKLDITCCDVEPAVLARNALLFTLLADEGAQDRMDLIWNIFYHFVVEQESLSLLLEQCRKLVALGKDLESWNAGPYARFLTVCDRSTLAELHRAWTLYAATADYTPERLRSFKKNFLGGMKETNSTYANSVVLTSSRSAGPLMPLAVEPVVEQFRKFWLTGITDDGIHSMERAKFVNPTFAFSAAGEKFAVHYGTDPVAGFHLAETFATSGGETRAFLMQKLVRAARTQFSQWCTSVVKLLRAASDAATPPKLVVRMFSGDVLMLCQAFSHLNTYGNVATPILTSPWKASRIEFDENQYGEGASTPAPTTFNVIDSSNVSDHVGLLNLLLVAAPILSKSPSATLNTEALLSYGDAPSAAILERLCGDLQTISLLLGVIPCAFLSRFTTRSNVHETFLHTLSSSGAQYHEQVAWKAIDGEYPISFAPEQLGQLLFGVYLKMFSDENMARQLQKVSLSPRRALLEQTLVHYTRRSFVQLLSHIKSRIQTDWTLVMQSFDDRVTQDSSLILGSNFYQEMCCHLHLLDVVTFTSMEQSYVHEMHANLKPAIFRGWESVPAVVTIVLVIPRGKITAVESDLRRAGTPLLQCEIRNARFWNIFSHITAAYGRLKTTGTGQTKSAAIVEEKEGESNSPLVVFFASPSSSLMLSLNATVGIRTRPSPCAMIPSLLEAIFSTPLEDSQYVHVLAEPPGLPATPPATKRSSKQPSKESQRAFSAQMNESHTEVRSFAIRVDVTDPAARASLAGGSSVKIEPALTRGASLYIDKHTEKIYFPLPVDVTSAKLRIARKSMYIEVIAPLALTMDVQNEGRIGKRFAPMLDGGIPVSWNVHRVNLDRCPSFKPLENPRKSGWLGPHVSLMFSHRERALRDVNSATTKDMLVNVKESLHSLLLTAGGTEGPARSVFLLQNTSTGEILAVIIVASLRLDVGSHTVLADAWVAPGTATVQIKLATLKVSGVVTIVIDQDESEVWRYLLPQLIERCRGWRHGTSCEYVKQGSIPLSPEAGANGEKSAFCSCGVGVGTKTFPQRFKSLAPYMTRVAISPLFAVPYLEQVGVGWDKVNKEECRACGKQGGTLSQCGKCKKVRYCSRECQVKDWKEHKRNCV